MKFSLPLCLSAILALLLVHQPSPVFAVSELDHGRGYSPLPRLSDEAGAAAYMRKYQHYGRRAAPPDSVVALENDTDKGFKAQSPRELEEDFAPPPQSIDIHIVAHTHDDVGWLSTPFA
jgi:hypothetical protein